MTEAPPLTEIEIHPAFAPLINTPHRFASMRGGRAGMKCLACGTLVMMHDATLRAVEDVVVGERVMGPDGLPRTVLDTTSGVGPLYRVWQSSGETYTVTENHILSLRKSQSCQRDTRKNPLGRYPSEPNTVNIQISEYVLKRERWKAHFRGYRAGLLNFEKRELLIDPYLLGLWLGDGHSYSLRIYNEDIEVADWCKSHAEQMGSPYRDEQESGSCRCLIFSIGGNGHKNALWQHFKAYGLVKNKHIPHDYIHTSEQDRLELLAGLMDTDGHYRESRHGFIIESTSKRLASDIKLLADTLGFRTNLTKKNTHCSNNGVRGHAWRLSIGGDVWRIPCRVARKQPKREEFGSDELLVSTLRVERVPDGPWAGFSLDGDHLFCLADGTVTHNSEQAHKIALTLAIEQNLRICCARETMASIANSSHKLLSDAIYAHGMAKSQNGPYEVQQSRIIRRDGDQVMSEFIFIGIREDVRATKSLKGINLTIVEEAAKVSEDSWDVLLPTVMRTDGARVWLIWNPEQVTDATYRRFVLNPPTGMIEIQTSYLDTKAAGWLPETTELLAEDCRRSDPEAFEHIWMGKPISAVKGAIFVEEMKQAEKEGRIIKVPYNRLKPVHTAWDLGIDTTAIWFVQVYPDRLDFIDFYQNKGQDLAHYLVECQRRGYVYGIDNLPHDGVDSLLHRKGMMGGNQDKSATIQTMMRDAGRRVAVGPKLLKADRIRTVRAKFSQCRFDAEKCAEGIQALKAYQWDRDSEEKPGEPKPLHNFASHPADAFMEACVSAKDVARRPVPVVHSGMAEAEV